MWSEKVARPVSVARSSKAILEIMDSESVGLKCNETDVGVDKCPFQGKVKVAKQVGVEWAEIEARATAVVCSLSKTVRLIRT